MTIKNITKQIDSKLLLDNVSFTLNNNDKIGLVGNNGEGKSTLLKIIAGKITKDSGDIINDETIGFLKQEIESKYNNLSIIEYIKKELKLDLLEEKLKELENSLSEENLNTYSDVLNEYMNLDGYNIEENLIIILNGLNLKKDLNYRIANLSGGEKIKVLIAIVIVQNTDILLLDEVTNNLDINAIEYLENKLKNSNKKMIIVSHDEEFLNNICNKIYELKDGKIKEYNLKYYEYLKEKELEYNKEKNEYDNLKEKKEKLKKQIEKAKEWNSIGTNKKAHSDNDKIANNYAKERTKSSSICKLNKELNSLTIPNFKEKESIKVFFNFDNIKGNKDIVLENLVCGYENFKLPKINIFIEFGSKLNIIGENGSGKTTLIKTIINELKPIEGKVMIGNSVKIGYISQNTLSEENEDTIYTYLSNDNISKDLLFTLLDKFNIPYEDKDKKYKSLSPGQRTRINIIKLILNNTNTLILDEVTNHLDKEALNLIYELIKEFDGTIISISHSRKYNEILDPDIQIDIKTGNMIYRKLKK